MRPDESAPAIARRWAAAILLMAVWWTVNYGFGAIPIPELQPQWFPQLGIVVTSLLSLAAVLGVALVLRRAGWLGDVRTVDLAGWRGWHARGLWMLLPMLAIALSYIWVGRDGVPGLVGSPGAMVSLAVGMLMVGLSEETASRGIPLALTAQRPTVWLGVLGTSLVFGLWHLGNGIFFGQSPGETWWQVLVTTSFGLCFAGARLAAVSLWPLVALHALGNWTQLLSPGSAPFWYQVAVISFYLVWGTFLVARATAAPNVRHK